MKICLCCGAQCAPAAPHCLACGEGSFDVFVDPAVVLEFTIQKPFFEAPPSDPPAPDAPPDGAGEAMSPAAPEETEPAQTDLLPGAPAAPVKRGPGRPRKDPPN